MDNKSLMPFRKEMKEIIGSHNELLYPTMNKGEFFFKDKESSLYRSLSLHWYTFGVLRISDCSPFFHRKFKKLSNLENYFDNRFELSFLPEEKQEVFSFVGEFLFKKPNKEFTSFLCDEYIHNLDAGKFMGGYHWTKLAADFYDKNNKHRKVS